MSATMYPMPAEMMPNSVTDVKWYAGLAMQAIIARQGVPDSNAAREEIALWAFRMAQAMVATDHRLHASELPPAHAEATHL